MANEFKRYKYINISRDPYTLGLTMNSMLDDLMQLGLDNINEKLLTINVEQAHSSHLIAVLRGLYSWKNQLDNWSILRDKTIEIFRSRNLNIEIILKGLI